MKKWGDLVAILSIILQSPSIVGIYNHKVFLSNWFWYTPPPAGSIAPNPKFDLGPGFKWSPISFWWETGSLM